ncbi:MAG TPA: hypothetical protein VJI75_02940 [Candidatus Nanoarchaeia archaeon]|nr:hypothetical protein [Candidatus Nanoarchaeia archaeon]
MAKKQSVLFVISLIILLMQAISVSASASTDAQKNWIDLKEATKEAQAKHQDAKLALAGDNSEQNRQAVVDTGKEVLNSALDEAEAWLEWKDAEAVENDKISDDLRNMIQDDVQKNIDKISGLKSEVAQVNNQAALGLMTLKLIGKYGELLVDVARDTGATWVYIANAYSDKLTEFEGRLRNAAKDNSDALALLDNAKSEIDIAERNIANAEDTYKQVVLPGKPFIKFNEANTYLRAAQINMINAQASLNQAYSKIIRR